MDEKLYPKYKYKSYNAHLDRPWILKCNLVYDDGQSKWSKGYRTRWGARIAAWFHYRVFSWGGEITLVDNREVNKYDRLIKQRELLVSQGVDPADLVIPIKPKER